MAISIDDIDVTIRGIGSFTLTELETNRVLPMPTPNNFNVSNNVTQQRIPGFNSAGYIVQGAAFPKGYDYIMTINYAQMQPELLALRLGSKFKDFTNKQMVFSRAIDVYDNDLPPIGGTAGKFGFSITADVDCNASAIVGGDSEVLTQVDHATFSPTATRSFAIGARGAFKFTNDLINKRVNVIVPYTVAKGKEWSNESVGKYRVDVSLITVADEVILMQIPSVTPNLEGGGLAPTAEGIELPFFIASLQGRKTPYDIVYTNEFI